MRVAVLFGPGAGSAERFVEIGESLSAWLEACTVLACPDPFGGPFLKKALIRPYEGGLPYRRRLYSAVAALVESGAELFVCVGGDGLASYVADAIFRMGAKIPLMGLAAGTANVGPIVAVAPHELPNSSPEELEFMPLAGIEVSLGGGHLAYGFNDVVIANTFLGTLDGRVESLSVEAMALRGEKSILEPSPAITTESFTVEKNGRALSHGTACPAQIIVSPLGEKEFYGRAIAGVLCEAAYAAPLAALALLDTLLVRARGADRGFEQFAKSEHLLFKPGDRVILKGLSREGQLVVDGNPFLRTDDPVLLECRAEVAILARPARGRCMDRRDADVR